VFAMTMTAIVESFTGMVSGLLIKLLLGVFV
jgi:hypothetical protein